MPKLAAKDRKKVQKAQAVGGGFEPLKPGKYVAELSGVEAKTSAAGNPMWVAEFSELHNMDGERQPGRQWYNLNLPTSDTPPEGYAKGAEKWEQYQGLCAGRIKQFFEVFGYSEDSDTDEMIGEKAVIQIGVRTIQNGARAGEVTNSVNGIEAYDEDKHGAASGGDDGDDSF